MRMIFKTVSVAAILAATSVAADTDKDEAKDQIVAKTREIGIQIGHNYACTADEDKEDTSDKIQIIFDLINKDLGTDLGYTFATAAGFGAAADKSTLDCEKLAEGWAKITGEFGVDDEEASE